MNKLLFSAKKEGLLIIRDIPGLLILFLMPVLLMTVVILAQEYTLQNQMGKTRLLFIDENHSGFASAIRVNLVSSGFFEADTLARGSRVSRELATELISAGKYPIGLWVGAGDTSFEIITDPALSGPYRTNIVTPLKYLIRGTQTSNLVEKMLSVSAGDMKPLIDKAVEESTAKLPAVKETFAGSGMQEIKPTAIQNIVPGFILFAMFFIVIDGVFPSY